MWFSVVFGRIFTTWQQKKRVDKSKQRDFQDLKKQFALKVAIFR
jgi:hypothetical protein